MNDYFLNPLLPLHKKYEALRAFFIDKLSVGEIAVKYGYQISTVYSYIKEFKSNTSADNMFFKETKPGKKPDDKADKARELVIILRKKYLSQSDIKSVLDSQDIEISERHIYNIIKEEGFGRLPRRSKNQKEETNAQNKIEPPKARLLTNINEQFNTQNAGVLCMLPYIKSYGIDELIKNSDYPGTATLPVLNSVLAFIGLKLLNIRRYSVDDLWCMDRGAGLFAGLNVLPKASWYSSYSNRITREMNQKFLKSLNKLWGENDLLSGEANLDFVTIPYWGEGEHLENNWSGARNQAMNSILAALAQDPETGIITYGDTTVRHDNESQIILEFLDFYRASAGKEIKHLVFDSKVTTYQNLRKLEDNDVKFITIRRRGKKIVEEIENKAKTAWKKVSVPAAGGKNRIIKVVDETIFLKDYGKELRQIAITGHGKIKPALIITNDFDKRTEEIVRRYAKRWLVEKTISEQTHFFHLNRVSSSMVIKVDFDLTMTILAHNLYRIFAGDLEGFAHLSSQSIYEKFIYNDGIVNINDGKIVVNLKKKRNLPTLMESLQKFESLEYHWNNCSKINFIPTSYS